MLDLKDSSTSVLQGLCQRADGKWDYAEIDLNDHYGNKLGKFESEGSGFKHTGRNFKLDAKDTSVLFQGELARPEGGYVAAEVELSICIVVKGAKFVFERHDGFWDRDGWLALNTEGLPVIGFITASIQNITDNEACYDQDHARRALANCSNSSIVTVAAVVGGFLPGGPAAAGLLAGLATPFALMAESQWADTIDDPRLRDEFEEATIGSAVVEGLTNMLGAAAGGYAGKYVGQWLGKYGKTLVGKAVAKAGSNAASKGAKAGSKAGQNAIDAASEAAAILLVQKIAEVMKGDDSYMKEWVEAQERAKQQRGK
ncbi:hypothetical protein BKA70DRAFT_1416018 [Coprinopsis sp. MPI-PUGE-AT-0042]|nr:hypothetical protein BKA70DRAFT_1416018 [Coprinopsis sp. MPI-PUGE-AT-0042]